MDKSWISPHYFLKGHYGGVRTLMSRAGIPARPLHKFTETKGAHSYSLEFRGKWP